LQVSDFAQQLANGVVLGMLYGLIALGYTMVYGIIQLINFAHGEIFMIGAFGSLTVFTLLGSPDHVWVLPLMIIGGIISAVAIAVIMERFAYRPLRNAPRLAPLITAIGVSVLLQESVRLLYPNAKAQRPYPSLITGDAFTIGGVTVDKTSLVIVILAATGMIALDRFVSTSSTGRAMRATAQDPDTARLMGIDTDRIIVIAFILGASLAAVAGVAQGLKIGNIDFHMGFIAGLKAFTAAVLGGIGNIRGAVLGGLVIGIIEVMIVQYLPGGNGSAWKDVGTFVVLILVLLLRPQGLLGEKVADRA
jgi:branched-chain amino acid transport system permease protein